MSISMDAVSSNPRASTCFAKLRAFACLLSLTIALLLLLSFFGFDRPLDGA
jgi:hypothetical protein